MTNIAARRAFSLAVALIIIGLFAATVVTLLGTTRPAPDRAEALSEQLRCPVCKSVSIADSPSDTATAMRQVVAEQVAAGRSDAEILGYFVARYGEWVLLDPPTSGSTLPLWLVPFAAGGVGAAVVLARVRRRRGITVTDLLAPDRVRINAAVARARAAERGGEDEL